MVKVAHSFPTARCKSCGALGYKALAHADGTFGMECCLGGRVKFESAECGNPSNGDGGSDDDGDGVPRNASEIARFPASANSDASCSCLMQLKHLQFVRAEIAMLRTGSGSIPKGAIAVRSEGELRAVPLFHRSMTPMRFPLLFPLGGDTVETALLVGSGGAIFILAAAGTGKTTVLKTCINNARAKGHIVLATAASAIAAQLLPGGTTFHRALNCPVSINEGDSLAFSVESDNAHARALRQTSMIVVDEGPMLHRFCWERRASKLHANQH